MPAKCVRILGISASYAPGARQGPITLVFSAHDEVHNDAVSVGFAVGKECEAKAQGWLAGSLALPRRSWLVS
jgi:hypothetical protein